MKRIRREILSVLLGICICLSTVAFSISSAETEENFNYIVKNGTVTVTKYIGNGTEAIVPSVLDDLPVTIIGESAFSNCKNIIRIVIPDTVQEIQPNAFWGCTNLKSCELPDSITRIESGVFFGCGFTSFVVPNNIISIGEMAFSECHKLIHMIIPDTVQEIRQGAFANCDGLTDMILPNSITTLESYMFCSCTSLRNVTIPDSVTSIGDYAFAYCNNLNRDIIPDSVTTLGAFVFSFCKGLNITIPVSVTEIDDAAFYSATWDTSSNIGRPIIGGVFKPTPNKDLTLWVYANSETQQQAQKHGIPYVTIIDYIADTQGDINGDGKIDASDALLALQHSVRIVDLRNDSLAMADMDQNGSVDAQDALQILQHSVSL